ncbi:MAG: hypothetical protein AB1411_14805 [Nitrospirota bacterium]
MPANVFSLLPSPIDRLVFPATDQALECLTVRRADLLPADFDGGVCYRLGGDGPGFVIWATGHRIVYGAHGRRVLCTDPSGTVLHECEWQPDGSGGFKLARARIRLDSLLWIGLLPEAVVHRTTLDLGRRPTVMFEAPECLRRMAARAWRVPLEDVRYFFPDESFEQDGDDRVTIHLKKDGLYLLEDGTFDSRTFLSYMGAMPWHRLNLLNVVELFQSTLPGTGSAVFELIWGLCDDQRRTDGTVPLHYRGLPTYPSEPAYGLFSSFFRPEAPDGADPHDWFVDPSRASQIAWWPRSDPPWRYVDWSRHLAVTVQGGMARKVTVMNDPAGVPYVAPGTRSWVSCDRAVVVAGNRLRLRDGLSVQSFDLDPAWGITGDTPPSRPEKYPFDWRVFFCGHPPSLDPGRAHSLALFYPDDETEVEELSTQPFVLEQIFASFNALSDLLGRLGWIRRVLIDGLDAVIAGCIDQDYTRHHTVLFRSAEWAQKQAQVLWDRAAQAGRLSAVQDTRFLPADQGRPAAYCREYELLYCWIPFACFRDRERCSAMVADVSSALVRTGLAVVAGPRELRPAFAAHGLRLVDTAGVEDFTRLPLLLEHLRLHPRTRLNPALAVFVAEKG